MVDPLTVVSLATEGLSICVKVVGILKRYAAAVKNVKKDLMALLKRVERMRNIFGLLRSLALELSKTSQKTMQLEIDQAECETTLEELSTLANEIQAKKQLMASLTWASKKNSAVKLTMKLRELEEDIINIVTVIGTTSSLRNQVDIEALKKDATSPAEIHAAFDNLSIVDGALQTPADHEGTYKPIRTWLGHVIREGCSEHYLTWRDKLSDAAFWGSWDEIWDALKTGEEEYNEKWANATRLKPLANSDEMSFWTPLHQAVYNRAPIEVVKRLVDAGAFRTLRSRWTRYSYTDMTPLELAHEFGFSYLYDILAPVIRNAIPPQTLTCLQEHFHNIIRTDLGGRVADERMHLPLLEVLTEIGNEPIWFPVKLGLTGAGYAYRLDGRVLNVKAVNITGENETQTYRISETEVQEGEEAIVTDD